MSVGARIAQKRKELGLSQEALGEQLKVSRQAIYKWESDATLPEIEKLVALAKLFNVPVGWLLGVEEESVPAAEREELTEQQLRMVEEIVDRYLAAQSCPKRTRRWPKVLAIAAVLVVGIHLFNRLDRMNDQYYNLQNAVNGLNSSVNSQIGGITNRVEEILKAQNDLTADYGTQLLRADLAANTVTFSLRAVPKTYVDGMSAVFLVNSGAGPEETAAQLSGGSVFSAEITTALTDEISLSVVFVAPDGTRKIQLLDTYDYLHYDSIPTVNLTGALHWRQAPNGVVNPGKDKYNNLQYADVRIDETKFMGSGTVSVEEIRVGVFVNRKLVAWGEECAQPDSYVGDWGEARFFLLPDVTLTLGEGDQLWIAALVTDNYGRQFMAFDIPYVVEYDEKGNGELMHAYEFDYETDPSHWVLTAD